VYTATLLRRSYRQDGKVKKETLANLSHLPPDAIDAIRRVLGGETLVSAEDAFEIKRSLPAGHVNAALAMARRLELPKLVDRSACRERDLCVAMIVGRVIGPGSKLGMVRTLGQSTLAQECGVVGADEDDLYAAMDWLVERQDRIEDRLAARHLRDGEMVLYDVSSSYFEGRTCPLGKRGYSRDGRPGLPQIIYGLLCDTDGRPVAVEVFTGELHDDKTLPSQVVKLKDRFGLSRVVVSAVAVRRAEPRGDHRRRGVPRRTTGRVPQPAGRRATCPQAQRTARRDGDRPSRDRSPCHRRDAHRGRPDRSCDRSGAEALPDAQALPDHDY